MEKKSNVERFFDGWNKLMEKHDRRENIMKEETNKIITDIMSDMNNIGSSENILNYLKDTLKIMLLKKTEIEGNIDIVKIGSKSYNIYTWDLEVNERTREWLNKQISNFKEIVGMDEKIITNPEPIIKKTHTSINEIKENEVVQSIIPVSTLNEPIYDTSIFTTYRGFQIFEAFKNEVITEATEYADYSFLFNKLKGDNLIQDIKHKKFISYLSKNHNSLLESKGYIQFKFSSTPIKIKAYSRFKKQFQ